MIVLLAFRLVRLEQKRLEQLARLRPAFQFAVHWLIRIDWHCFLLLDEWQTSPAPLDAGKSRTAWIDASADWQASALALSGSLERALLRRRVVVPVFPFLLGRLEGA